MRLLKNAQRRLANVASGGEIDRLTDGLVGTLIQLKESDRKLERFKEELGWTRQSEEQKSEIRQTVRDNCRYQFQRGNPFIKGAVKLMTEFCFEQGIDGPVSEDETVQAALDEFWNQPDNQEALFSTVAQHRASNQLLVDGDYFTILREGTETAIRYMPARYVVDAIMDPSDVARTLYYKCLIPEFEWDSQENNWVAEKKTRTVFYRDIFNFDPANDPLYSRLAAKTEENAFLEHIAINAIDPGGFGWPEPAVSMPWFNFHKGIAEDQATVSRATAELMNVLRVDATSDAIDTLIGDLEARGQTKDGEYHEGLAGQMNVMNQQVDLAVSRASSRAGEAEVNIRMMHMGGVVGMGIPLHYSGDPDNAGLATATTMDRPTLVHMRAYQSLWIDHCRKLIDFALKLKGIVDAQYDIPAPRISRQDISEATPLILGGADRGLLTERQGAATSLDLLGYDDIAKELEIREQEMEAEEEAEVTPLETEPEEESEW